MALLALAALIIVSAQATETDWTKTSDAPFFPRVSASLAFDFKTNTALVAGGVPNGVDKAPNYWLNDVWRVDSEGKWTIVTPGSYEKPRNHWKGRATPGLAVRSDGTAVLAGGE